MSFNIIANPFSVLRHAHPNLSGKIAYFGGGSSATPTSTTVTNTNIPEEFMPYFGRAISRAEELSLQPYQPYGGPRIAESENVADIAASRSAVRDIASSGIPGLDTARRAAEENIGIARGLGSYAPGSFSEFQFGPARQFTNEEVNKYMSPYIQNVLDVQKSRAVEDFDRLRGARNTRAVQAGAFGGSRQAVQEGMAEEALGRQLGEIEATGRQAAFEQASRLFGEDRAAQLDYGQAQAGERGRVETATEASRQFGAGQGIAALGAAGAEAGRLAALGEAERASEIRNAQLLEGIGKDQLGEIQRGYDTAYEDFLRQGEAPMEKIGQLTNILQGLPIGNTGSTTETNYGYTNPAAQGLGAGISALSLYKAYG